MQDELKILQDKVGVLVSWVSDMKNLIQNPYSSGVNIAKVIEDLGGYAADLTKTVYMVGEKLKELEPTSTEEESEKAESASAEQ